MPTNDFIGFASAGSANIMSQADYAAAAEQTDGVQPGPASSALANKIWRQGANMAAAVGQMIVTQGSDALDNGDIGALATNLTDALKAIPVDYTTVNFEDVSVPSGSTTNLGSYIFPKKGIYLIEFVATFSTNASGHRRLMIATTATGSSYNRYVNVRLAPLSGSPLVMTITCFVSISAANEKLYFNAYQQSGSALDVSDAGAAISYLGGA